MELIIEEISRGRKVLSRHKYNQREINIGRSFENDMILSDPHICGEHLTISFNGESWQITDHQSVNGSFLDEGKQTADKHIVNSGDVIRMGQSQIRLLLPNHPVADTIELSPFESLINNVKNPIILVTNVLIFALLTGWIFFLNNGKEVNFTQLLVPTFSITLMFALWPLGVALVSHLTKHDARVWAQIGVCFLFYNITWGSDFIETLVNFNTASDNSITMLVAIIPILLAFMMFWLNLYVGFHMTSRRRNTIAASFVVLLFGGSYLIQMSKQPEFTAKPSFDSTLLTPTFLMIPSSNVDSFLEKSDDLFNEINSEIKENAQ